jgi:hypothetical protein
MTRELAGLLLANALLLPIGVSVALLVGAIRSRWELVTRLGLAYLAGLAVVGVTAATMAVARIPVGRAALVVLALASVAVALPRLRRLHRRTVMRTHARTRSDVLLPLVGLSAVAAILLRAWPAFVSAPIEEWDAWAIWALKGRALYELGLADPAFFASASNTHSAYPLLIPALEAIQFRAMGTFDPQAIHIQFLLIGVALVAGIGGALYDLASPWLLWPSLVAIATAPAVLGELLTAYADIPLAAFFAVGTAAAARWLVSNERWALAAASLLYAAALLTKYEAMVFVACAFLALVAALAHRRELRARGKPLVPAAVAAATPLAVWRVYVAAYDLETGHAGPGDFAFQSEIFVIALRRLIGETLDVTSWGYLVVASVIALVGASLTRGDGRSLALFGMIVVSVPLVALALNYAASPTPHDWYLATSADRVVSSLVLAGAALVPLLGTQALRPHDMAAPGRLGAGDP